MEIDENNLEIYKCNRCGEKFIYIGRGKPKFCNICIKWKYKRGKNVTKLNILGTSQLSPHRNKDFDKEKDIIHKELIKLKLNKPKII